jgi:hypothetical protein
MAEILKLTYGKPETIAFKFDSGKDVDGRFGPQVAFSAVDRDGRDQILYLDPEPASNVEHELKQLGIRTREYFRITKIKNPRGATMINVERIDMPATAGAPASHGNSAPATAGVPVTTTQTPPANGLPQGSTAAARQITPLSTRLCASMCALIDAMKEAKAYAQRSGIDLTNEDLRCLANSAFIQEAKGGLR